MKGIEGAKPCRRKLSRHGQDPLVEIQEPYGRHHLLANPQHILSLSYPAQGAPDLDGGESTRYHGWRPLQESSQSSTFLLIDNQLDQS